jgi:hypothetical protein
MRAGNGKQGIILEWPYLGWGGASAPLALPPVSAPAMVNRSV